MEEQTTHEKRTQQHSFGYSIIGTPTLSNPSYRLYTRYDTYFSKDGSATPQRIFCLDSEDVSDQADLPYASFPGNVSYHSACASCYLGHGHSVALHNARLEKA